MNWASGVIGIGLGSLLLATSSCNSIESRDLTISRGTGGAGGAGGLQASGSGGSGSGGSGSGGSGSGGSGSGGSGSGGSGSGGSDVPDGGFDVPDDGFDVPDDRSDVPDDGSDVGEGGVKNHGLCYGVLSCVSDGTSTSIQAWTVSQDISHHGPVTYLMLGAGANHCMANVGLPSCAITDTQTLWVDDPAGHSWDVQYYIGDQPFAFSVGDVLDFEFHTTVAADGRPKRTLVISRGGSVIIYQSEAMTLAELALAPVTFSVGAAIGHETIDCVEVEHDALVASVDGASVSIAPGGQAQLGAFQIIHSSSTREVARSAGCTAPPQDRIDVAVERLPP